MKYLNIVALALMVLFPESLFARTASAIGKEAPTDYGWPHLLGMAGIGLVLGPVSNAVRRWFKGKAAGWEAAALKADDRISDYTERKWGFRLPAIVGDVHDAGIRTVFHGAEELVTRPDMIRNIIRAAIALSPARGLAVMADLSRVSDFTGYFYDQLTDDTRELFNLEKQKIAENMVQAAVRASKAIDVKTFVAAAASADKSYKIQKTAPATPADVARIVAEESGKPVEPPTRYAERAAAGEDMEKLLQEALAKLQAQRLARSHQVPADSLK